MKKTLTIIGLLFASMLFSCTASGTAEGFYEGCFNHNASHPGTVSVTSTGTDKVTIQIESTYHLPNTSATYSGNSVTLSYNNPGASANLEVVSATGSVNGKDIYLSFEVFFTPSNFSKVFTGTKQ